MKKTFEDPLSQEREYTRLLLGYSRLVCSNITKEIIPLLPSMVNEFNAGFKSDSWLTDLNQVFERMMQTALGAASSVTARLPGMFAAVSRYNDAQFKMVVKANTGMKIPDSVPTNQLLGVNVFRSEPFLKPLAEGWIAENTSLIKSIPTKLYPELEDIIRRGVMSGQSVKDIKDQIKSRYPVTDNRAKLIAQDQTTKLNSDLTRYRLESVGVKKYTWRTVQDSRVRPKHADRNGKVYSWDKPPADGDHPGREVRCRCRAEAIWDDDEALSMTEMVNSSTESGMKGVYGANGVNVLRKYFGDGFEAVNSTLRAGRSNSDTRAMDAVFKLAPVIDQPTVLYRGVKISPAQLAAIEPGKTVIEKAFSSTTREFHQAAKFGWNKGVPNSMPTVFKVKAPAGTKMIVAGELAKNKFEKEVLLDRGIRYKVVKIYKKPLGSNPLFDPKLEINVVEVEIVQN